MSAFPVEWLTEPGEILLGSLFSGYGGLDRGTTAVLEALTGRPVRTVWVSDIDPGANRILAHRFPDVPNLGDVTAVDWRTVVRPHVLCLGFPCQDLSHAGKRLGLKPDTRSGLWSFAAYAISVLRPRLVVVENVRGLLSAEAHSDLEPCPWCVGDDSGEPALRALGAVLGDLADLRYDAQWVGVRAADVGAPHGRFRVFAAAWPAAPDAAREGREGPVERDEAGDAGPAERAAADPGRVGRGEPAEPAAGGRAGGRVDSGREAVGAPAPDADGAARDERRVAASGEAESGRPRADARGRGRASAADADGVGAARGPVDGPADGAAASRGGTPRGRGRAAAADTEPVPPVEHRGRRRVARPASGGSGADGDAARPGVAGGGAVGDGGTAAVSGRGRSDVVGGRGRRRAAGEPGGRDVAADAGLGGRGRGVAAAQGREPDADGGDRGDAAVGRREVRPGSAAAARGLTWGPYATAIRRWELTLGRVAPPPTIASPRLPQWQAAIALRRTGAHPLPVGRRGPIPRRPAPVLNPAFVEWMMGLPAGWVTDVPGISRAEALKALGNGVVPQQAAYALALMLGAVLAEAAA